MAGRPAVITEFLDAPGQSAARDNAGDDDRNDYGDDQGDDQGNGQDDRGHDDLNGQDDDQDDDLDDDDRDNEDDYYVSGFGCAWTVNRSSSGRRPKRPDSRQLRLEKRLARAALARYGLPGDARLQVLSWRARARVFLVLSRSRERFVLRLYRTPKAGEREAGIPTALHHTGGVRLYSPDVLGSQLLWLSALGSETDLLVPEPLPMDDGSLVGQLSPDNLEDAATRKGRIFMVLRWVPGKDMRGEYLRPRIMSLAGSYVAQLHRHAEEYEILQGATVPRWDWEWPFGESAPLWRKGEAYYSSSEMDAFRAAAYRCREELEALEKHSGAFGLVHHDLALSNLLFNNLGLSGLLFKRNQVGAVDFDRCGLGYYLSDLATVRTSLGWYHGGALEPLWAAFIKGYERERPLPEGFQQHLTTFDMMRRVAAVNTQLVLLSLGNAGARSRGPEFLAGVARWLKERCEEGGPFIHRGA